MKLIPRGKPATPDKHFGGRPRMPDWQKEWVANQGVWVLLECGCIDDLNPRLLPLVRQMLDGHLEIYCDKHEGFYRVTRKSSAGERVGIVSARVPDEPMF